MPSALVRLSSWLAALQVWVMLWSWALGSGRTLARVAFALPGFLAKLA